MTESFRVIAIMSAFNEADIISPIIGHLVENGIEVYLIDNRSTDATITEASRWLGRGLLHIESFPPDASADAAAFEVFDWTAILHRKEELAQSLKADWFIHHDADEIREGPWPGLTLKEAMRRVDTLGYNCIDFRAINFPPVDDGFKPGDYPHAYFTLWEDASDYDRVQLKAWKAGIAPISLAPEGGHEVQFAGRNVFPIQFLLRHYPIRGQTHGTKKVFGERIKRFLASERSKGWHIQYDKFVEEGHRFLADPATLHPFDLDQTRLELMMPDKIMEEVATLRKQAQVLRDRTQGLMGEMEALLRHAAVDGPAVLLLDDVCPPLVREIYAALMVVAADKTRIDDPALQNQIAHWTNEFERIKSPLTLAVRLFAQREAATLLVAEGRAREAELQALQEVLTREGRAREAELQALQAELSRERRDREAESQALQAELSRERRDREAESQALQEILSRERRDREAESQVLQAELGRLGHQLEVLLHSRSWNLTAPLRRVYSVLRSRDQDSI